MSAQFSIPSEPVSYITGYLRTTRGRRYRSVPRIYYDECKYYWRKPDNSKRKTLRSHRRLRCRR